MYMSLGFIMGAAVIHVQHLTKHTHLHTPAMCYEVKVFYPLCRHSRYFIVPSGTIEESPRCYVPLERADSHLSNHWFTARIRIVDTVHECMQNGCAVRGQSVDYLGLLIAALRVRQRGAADPHPTFPWGVDRHVEGVQWSVTDWWEEI